MTSEDEEESPQTPSAPTQTHTDWWASYRGTTGRDAREVLVRAALTAGEMKAHLAALTPEQRRGEYQHPYQQALDLVQSIETQRAAGATLPEMATTQSDFMRNEETRIAKEASGGDKDVTEADLDKAREQRLEQDYAPEADVSTLIWPTLDATERAEWVTRGAAAKTALLAHLKAKHPKFALNDDQIVVKFEEVEAENAVAYNDGADHCVIGFDIVAAIERNPEFAVSTVAHELFGHNEFDQGFSVSEELYKASVARQRGVPVEDVVLTSDEWSRFNYFESEIASLVWEYDLYVASDSSGQSNPIGSPADYMTSLLTNLNGQWAPDLIGPLVTGLHARFRVDPDISDAATAFFADACNTHLGVRL
jgi:hypothetical protein